MTAQVIRFPARRSRAVIIMRECEAWLVLSKQHGWLHGAHGRALADATEIADGHGVAVIHRFPATAIRRLRRTPPRLRIVRQHQKESPMAFEHKTNRGSLWKNKKARDDKDPTHTGSANIEGVGEVYLSAWVEEAKDGQRYFSIAFKAKQPQQAKQVNTESAGSSRASSFHSDDIPFAPEVR
jgi:hypothetical protein